MYLGKQRIFRHVDYLLYRFMYAVLFLALFFYSLNLLTTVNKYSGVIYYEVWCFLVNTVYGLTYLLYLLTDKVKVSRTRTVAPDPDANPSREPNIDQSISYDTTKPEIRIAQLLVISRN
jgi:hypothetical protein